MRLLRDFAVVAVLAAVVTLCVSPSRAHTPITSPYTYNEDVFPVLRDRCGSCHVEGGVAPMSLLTHDDAVPWGESIRVELLAGHMPPWSVDAAPDRFHNVESITANEMDVLLTWATGGTPLGNPEQNPAPSTPRQDWSLGAPDLLLPFPTEFTLAATVQQETIDFVIPTGLTEPRWVRAVDLLPGTPSIVRAASVRVRSPAPPADDDEERLLALWLPGDRPVPLDAGTAFELPAGAELFVRVHYRKTWQYERQEMKDRSTVGLYFAPEPSVAVRAIGWAPAGPPSEAIASGQLVFSRTLSEDVRALSIYPDENLTNVGIVVVASRPNGSRTNLIAFHPRTGWTRRYWFREPVSLERGTKLEATVTFDDRQALAVLSLPPAVSSRPDRSNVRLTMNVIPAR